MFNAMLAWRTVCLHGGPLCVSVHMLGCECLAELTAGVFNPTIKSV